MNRANEMNPDLNGGEAADKTVFLKHFCEVLKMTRKSVVKLSYYQSPAFGLEWVIVEYRGGSHKKVNVTADSYTAMLKDILDEI